MEEFFDVYFIDDDRMTVLQTQKVKKGEKAIYTGKTPTKEQTIETKYTFKCWDGEEKLESITEDTIVYALYDEENISTSKDENDMYNASLENAENSNLQNVFDAGQKVSSQQLAVEKDSRTTEEIVNDIVENGKTEVGQEVNKDMEK